MEEQTYSVPVGATPWFPAYSTDEISRVFAESVVHVIGNYDDDAYETVMGFIVDITGRYASYRMMTPSELPKLATMVFDSVHIRDFILSLQYTFLSRWLQGRGHHLVLALFDDLACGVSHDAGMQSMKDEVAKRRDFIAIPEQVLGDMVSQADASLALQANPWVAMVLLIQLNINLETFKTLKRPAKAQTQET